MDWYTLTLEQWLNLTLYNWTSLPLEAATPSVTVDSTNYFYCRSPDGVYKNVRWRWFYVRCPKLGWNCSSKSGAYVSAITVCNQQLWLNDFGQNQ